MVGPSLTRYEAWRYKTQAGADQGCQVKTRGARCRPEMPGGISPIGVGLRQTRVSILASARGKLRANRRFLRHLSDERKKSGREHYRTDLFLNGLRQKGRARNQAQPAAAAINSKRARQPRSASVPMHPPSLEPVEAAAADADGGCGCGEGLHTASPPGPSWQRDSA